MTRDDITRMAREAGVSESELFPGEQAIERFAALVAAAELRRLHEEVQEQCRINGMGAERELRLMAEKRELLEALKEIEWSNNEQWRTDRARAAIAKAEGETK